MEELINQVRLLTEAVNQLVELQSKEKLLKQRDVAILLGVSDSTVMGMVKRGQIKAVSGVGKTLKFRLSDVNKFLKK